MKLIRCVALLFAAGLVFMVAAPAFATSPPDSTPVFSDVHINTDLIETGDALIYGKYDIPYASLPSDDAGKTYSIRVMNGTTQVGVVSVFPQFDSGYNEGAFGLYFSASDNLDSSNTYTLRFSQSPAYFTTPTSYSSDIPASAWTSAATQEANQTEVSINIIAIAEDLEIAHSTTLLESSVGGTVLSDPTGETYFRGAIYGIQVMAPDLFLVQSLTWDTTDRSWSATEFDSYGSRFSGTFIGSATDNTSATAGLDATTFMGLFYALPIIIGAAIISNIKWKRTEPAYMVGAIVLILAVLMGWLDPALFALIFQLCAMYIGYLWFYSRTGDSFGSKMFSYLAFVWIMSTLICLVVEGSWLGSTEATVINDLSAFTSLKIGGLVPIPSPNLYFFRGVFRMLLWNYSFYSGDFEIFRYIWLVVFTGAAVWGLAEKFAPVFANFLRIR